MFFTIYPNILVSAPFGLLFIPISALLPLIEREKEREERTFHYSNTKKVAFLLVPRPGIKCHISIFSLALQIILSRYGFACPCSHAPGLSIMKKMMKGKNIPLFKLKKNYHLLATMGKSWHSTHYTDEKRFH